MGLPLKDDGSCANLDGSRCSIYEARPLVCRIDDLYDELHAPHATREEIHHLTAELCNGMQVEDGLDESLRVVITPHSD